MCTSSCHKCISQSSHISRAVVNNTCHLIIKNNIQIERIMDLRIIVMLLICALRANADELNSLEIPGCEYSRFEHNQSVYDCPNSIEPNFVLKYNQNELFIHCKDKYRLESLPGQNLSIFNNIRNINIRGCKFGMAAFGNQINISVLHQENLDFRSFNIPAKITIVEFFHVGLFRLPKYLFKNRNDLWEVTMIGNEHNIKLPSGLFSNLPQLSKITMALFKLTYIPKNTFSNSTEIKKIDLSHNQLEKLPDGLFDGLTNLEKLNIQFNRIQTISSNLFRDLRKLTELNLVHNQISNAITK